MYIISNESINGHIDKNKELSENESYPVTENNKVNCLICKSDIDYMERAIHSKCYYCGIKEDTYFVCKNGHYVCNKCHSRDAIELIGHICMNTDSTDPFMIAERIMEHPGIHMHGPEHHALVPAALVAAYGNLIGQKQESKIKEAIKRGRNVPGGYCGLYGACGAGVGIGIAICVLLDATPLKPYERSHANRATSRTLLSIADAGGARCCKKATRISLEEGVAYMSELFDLKWGQKDTDVKCTYNIYNKECDKNCKYL